MKKPTKRPEWDDFGETSEFAADGHIYGRVERFQQAWQGTFLGKPAGVGATKEDAKREVEAAYERWI